MSEPEFKPISEVFHEATKLATQMEDPLNTPGAVIDGQTLLRVANDLNKTFLAIIERLAMAGSSVHAAQRLFVLKIEQLKKGEHPASTSLQFSGPMTNAAIVEEAFADEIGFMRDINKLISDQMLRSEGIDPKDTAAVQAHIQRNLPQ